MKTTAAAPDGKALSQVLFDQLAIQRRDVLGAALLGSPALALDYMLFAMIDDRGLNYDGKSGTTIRASRPEDPIHPSNMQASRARDYIDEFAEALNDTWKDAGSKTARFEAFRALDDEAKAQWMAWAVATSLTAKDEYGAPAQNAMQNRLASILDIDVASWWRPTSVNYFDRVSKGAVLTLLDQIGGPALSGRHASQKKTEISASCEKLFAGDVIIEADVREAALAWVPPAMQFIETVTAQAEAQLDEPSEAEAEAEGQGDLDHEDDDLTLTLADEDDLNPDDEDLSLSVDDQEDGVDDREYTDDPGVNDHLELVAAQ